MLMYYAGLRVTEVKQWGKLPDRVLFSFDDTGPYGDGEQRKMFRLLWEYRRSLTVAGYDD